jgi:hypothetical protein
MENKKLNGNIIPGVILIAVGILFFLKEFNFVDFNWTSVLRLWPIVLVIIGVNMILGGKSNANFVLLIGALVAIPLLFLRGCSDKFDKIKNKNKMEFNFDDDGKKDSSSTDSSSTTKFSTSTSSTEDMEKDISSGKLKLDAGFSSIELAGATNPSFLYETEESSMNTRFEIKKVVKDGTVLLDVDSNTESNDQDDKSGITLKLNNTIPWVMDIDLGLAGAKLDLKDYNITKLKLDVGMAGTDIILGDKAEKTMMDIDAGMSAVSLRVPEAVGIKVRSDSFLSGVNLNGFVKEGDYYFSKNYEASKSKLEIKFSSAFSGFDIKRY